MKAIGGLEMGIFGKKDKSDVNQSRRKFLGQAAVGLGGIAAGLSVPGMVFGSSDTPIRPGQAPYPWNDKIINQLKEQGVPNGIIHSGDPALPSIWSYGTVNPGQWSSQYQTRRHNLALRGLGIGNRVGPMRIHNQTPYQEPAFFMTAHKVGMHPKRIVQYSEVERENPKLYHFAEGLDNYFKRWVENEKIHRSRYEREIEDHFMKSILLSAGRPVSDAQGYQNLNETERERFLAGVRDSILGRDYNSQLVAAWSSFMLANHHMLNRNSTEEEMYRIYNFLEVPLADSSTSKTFALRGDIKYIGNRV